MSSGAVFAVVADAIALKKSVVFQHLKVSRVLASTYLGRKRFQVIFNNLSVVLSLISVSHRFPRREIFARRSPFEF